MNKKTLSFLLVSTFFVLACGGDSEPEKDTTKEDVMNEMEEAVETAQAYSAEEKREMMLAFQQQSQRASLAIDSMKGQLEKIPAKSKKAWSQRIDDLEQKQQSFEQRISDLETSSEEAYKDLKTGIDSAGAELSQAVRKARNEFTK